MPSYTRVCDKCEHYFLDICSIAERDHEVACEKCGHTVTTRLIETPNLMFTAMLDGTKRGGDYARLKEAAKLECIKANLPGSDRREIQKTIDHLRKPTK